MKHLLITLMAMVCAMQAIALEKLKVNGADREMIVYAPKNLPAQSPLVIACHGMNQDAPYLQNGAHWEYVADTAKFVVVYPNGIGDADGSNRGWDISGNRDINFVLAIIDEMYKRYGINKNRVYVTGFSMGGMFTYHCANKIADKIAAFAPVSGYPMGGPSPSASRPVPILHTHGTSDDVCVYNNAPTHVKAWAKFDGCDATPETIKPYPANKPNSPAKMEIYRHGKQGVEVALLTLADKGHWWSCDESQAHTTREVWNFCKRYSLGKPEPELQSVTPEDKSFDLLCSTDTSFTLLYTDTVNTTKARAILKHSNGESITLENRIMANQRIVRFLLPAGTTLTDGRYTLSISSLLTSEGRSMQDQSFRYEYGMSQVADELKIDTIFAPDLAAERGTIGEGIPSGWRRNMIPSSGSAENTSGPAANVTGCRMKYFTPGGDFNEGFYLSARDQSAAKFSYGVDGKYPLLIEKGDYNISFNSIYWSEGSKSAGATFNFRLKTYEGGNVLDCGSLKSTGCLSENANQKITGSKVQSFDFTATSTTKHIMYFEMTEGWNSVIFGNIVITAQPSFAEQYKGTFHRLYLQLQQRAEEYPSNSDIQAALTKYKDFASTTPSAYTQVITELQALLKKYPTSLSSLHAASNSDNGYYNLLGQKIAAPSHGIYIHNGRKVVIK